MYTKCNDSETKRRQEQSRGDNKTSFKHVCLRQFGKLSSSLQKQYNAKTSTYNKAVKGLANCFIAILHRQVWVANGRNITPLNPDNIMAQIDPNCTPSKKLKIYISWFISAAIQESESKRKKAAGFLTDHWRMYLQKDYSCSDDDGSDSEEDSSTSDEEPESSSNNQGGPNSNNSYSNSNSNRSGSAASASFNLFQRKLQEVSRFIESYYPKTAFVVMQVVVPSISRTRTTFEKKEIIQAKLEVHPDKVSTSLPSNAKLVADKCIRILNQVSELQDRNCTICRSRFSCKACSISITLDEINEAILYTSGGGL